MYALLYSALKNMGDFLIYERTKELLRKHKGMQDYVEIHGRRESLDPQLDRVNATKAVIICGGPGIVWNMYPGKYLLATNLDDIKVPIIIMGTGWYGVPGDDATLAQYDFNASTMRLLQRATADGRMIGVRDHLTKRALTNNGIANVRMIGCPSWYDLDHLDSEFRVPDPVKTVVFTPPAKRLFRGQAVGVMEMLRRLFPDARMLCSFHRGLTPDEQTPEREARWLGELAQRAGDLGYEVVDASYGLESVRFYEDCDLHIGYRVHGHLYFLAKRKPSFLIQEDGRGRGASEALGLPDIRGWERTAFGRVAAKVKEPRFSYFLEKRGMDIRARRSVPSELERYIRREMEGGFGGFEELPQTLRQHYGTMVQFLESIP